MSIQQVTASRTNRSLVSGMPDRAADLQARRRNLAEIVLLLYRRNLDTALAEAKKTRDGHPTDLALQALWWIQAHRADPADKAEYFGSFAGACEMLGLEERAERSRMLLEIKAAYAKVAAEQIQSYVQGRLAAVLTCGGVRALDGRQYVLGLVSVEEYDEVAGIERPDPPARGKRAKQAKAVPV